MTFEAVSLLSRKLVTDEIARFWSTSPTFSLVLFRFLMSPNSIIHYSSGNFYFLVLKKNAFQSIFQTISGYAKVKATEEDLYLV